MKKIKLVAEKTGTIAEKFEEFQQFHKIRDYAKDTIDGYDESYKAFARYYSSDNSCSSINMQVVNGFIWHLKEKGTVNNISINSYLKNIRAFVNYCARLGYMEEFKVQLLTVEKKIKETYTDSELITLLKKPNMKKCGFAEYRNWVFINYLLATGNRVSTIINIKIGDIDFDNDTIILKRTKNKNQQIIPISNSLKIVLLEYLKHRKGTNEDYLFCTLTGQQMIRGSVRKSIAIYNRSRGVTKTSIHLFRHTFAKNWILNGRRYIPTTKTAWS